MPKGCPHTPLPIGFYNTILRQNRVSQEVLTELSQVSKKVSDSLINQEVKLDFRYIPDMDLEKITEVFESFISCVLEDLDISKKLSRYMKKSGKFFLENNHNDSIRHLLVIAITDIFSLVAMQINYGIDKNRLKGLLYLNMNFGDNTPSTNVSRIVQVGVITKKSPEDILLQLKEINHPRDIKKHGEPACPFYLDKNKAQ